jgi:hypothetical protein
VTIERCKRVFHHLSTNLWLAEGAELPSTPPVESVDGEAPSPLSASRLEDSPIERSGAMSLKRSISWPAGNTAAQTNWR